MDWSVVLAVLGALGVGGTGTAAFTSWLQRRHKLEERQAARDDAHRDELRRAYSEFIATYSKFLNAAGLMLSIHRAIEELREEAEERAAADGAEPDQARHEALTAVSPELEARGRRSLEDFWVASEDANTKGIAVLLVDDNEERRVRMIELANANLLAPQSRDDNDRFVEDVRGLRTKLDQFIVSISGAFSPARWHSELAARRALPQSATRLQLPASE